MHRFFGVAMPLCQVDPAAPVGSRSQGGPTCEFCGCQLAADGAVLKTSQRARELARVDERIERLESDLATARGRVTELETELAAAIARPAPAPEPAPRRGLHFGE